MLNFNDLNPTIAAVEISEKPIIAPIISYPGIDY